MKILLDENLDHRVRKGLAPHVAFTAAYSGFAGLKNGALLTAAESGGFDVLLTGDQTLYQEQNLSGRRAAVVRLSPVEWRILKDHLPKIVAAIDKAVAGTYQWVDCGKFSRKRDEDGASKLAQND